MKSDEKAALTVKVRAVTKRMLDALNTKYGSSSSQVIDHLVEQWVLQHDAEVARSCEVEVRPANPFVGGVPSGGPPSPVWGNDGRPALMPSVPLLPQPSPLPFDPTRGYIGEPVPSPMETEVPPSQRGRMG